VQKLKDQIIEEVRKLFVDREHAKSFTEIADAINELHERHEKAQACLQSLQQLRFHQKL